MFTAKQPMEISINDIGYVIEEMRNISNFEQEPKSRVTCFTNPNDVKEDVVDKTLSRRT